MRQPSQLTNMVLVAYTAVVFGCRHNDALDPSEPAVVPWADAGNASPPSMPPMPGDESPTARLELEEVAPSDVGSMNEPLSLSSRAAVGSGGFQGQGGSTGGLAPPPPPGPGGARGVIGARAASPQAPRDGLGGAGGRIIGPPGAAGAGGTATGGTAGRLP